MGEKVEMEIINEIFSDVEEFVSENENMTDEDVEFLTNCLVLNDYIDKNDISSVQNILDKMVDKN